MARRGENIYKRKDGRYEGRYVIGKTLMGKTRFGYVYARHYAEVRRLLLQKKAELLGRTEGKEIVCRGTLDEWMTYWMENELLGSVKASSYQTYLGQINRHLRPALGQYALSQLTPGIVYSFVEKKRGEGLSGSTIRGIYRLLSAAMRFALDEGVILKNPCRKIRVLPEERTEQRVLNHAEQEKLRSMASSEEELPALLSLYTGMRLGEVCALKGEDIDWEKRTITVRRTAQRVAQTKDSAGGKTLLMIGTPKSSRSHRAIPVPAFLLERLHAQMEEKSEQEYIFGTSTHAAEPRTLQRRFKRFMKKLGIAGAHFHTLRHPYVKLKTKLFSPSSQRSIFYIPPK